MRKFFYLLPCVLLLSACNASEMGTLTELTRPYAGEYVCEELTYGGRDLLENFDYIRLSLSPDESFSVSYKTAFGGEGSYGGGYSIDEKKGEIVLSGSIAERTVSRAFPMKDGAVYLDYVFGGSNLHAVFRLP